MFFSVISFSIGAIIDEALGAHYDKNFALQKSNSKARTWIVFKWMIVGFFLTVSYKSVLRAMMMKIYYENTIDDIDDMLASDRTLIVPTDVTFIKFLFLSDPRRKVKKLRENAIFVQAGKLNEDDEHLINLAKG